MRILVDADACPSVDKVETVAKKNGWQVLLFVDTCHMKTSEYSEVRVCDKGADSVDFALLNECRRDDVVITHDYGLAAMVLGKGARAIHSNGWWYSNENTDRLLMERHEVKKKRKSSKNHIKGPAKRTPEDERQFEKCLEALR